MKGYSYSIKDSENPLLSQKYRSTESGIPTGQTGKDCRLPAGEQGRLR